MCAPPTLRGEKAAVCQLTKTHLSPLPCPSLRVRRIGAASPPASPLLYLPSAHPYYQQISTYLPPKASTTEQTKNPVFCRSGDHYQANYEHVVLKQLYKRSK